MNKTPTLPSFIGLLLAAGATQAQLTIPNADGSDGTFNPTNSVTIDLGLATNGNWATPGTGNGVYDPEQWAVFFKFSDVHIPPGVSIRFKNHPSRCPVIWLVSGNCTISGNIYLDGAARLDRWDESVPGPGGYRGGYFGTGVSHGKGFGPIGDSGWDGRHWPNYSLVPLWGGGGGYGRGEHSCGCHERAGAGGGAFLLAVANVLDLNGAIYARGGGYNVSERHAGAGGMIRLIADRGTGNGQANTYGSRGRIGRVRLELNQNLQRWKLVPTNLNFPPGPTAKVVPGAADPTVKISKVNGVAAPSDPTASMDTTADISINTSNSIVVELETKNIPMDARVVVRGVRRSGDHLEVVAVHSSGTEAQSIWTATFAQHTGFTTLISRVETP